MQFKEVYFRFAKCAERAYFTHSAAFCSDYLNKKLPPSSSVSKGFFKIIFLEFSLPRFRKEANMSARVKMVAIFSR